MPWIEKYVNCGDVIYVKRCFASRYGTKGVIKHNKTGQKTSPAQETVNDRNKMERFAILANANFGEGDYFITFTFRREDRPRNIDDCRAIWDKFLRKMRIVYRKNDAELKYLWGLEWKNTQFHYHFLCNNANVNVRAIRKLWGLGGVHLEILDNRAYHTVGEYIMKENHLPDDSLESKTHVKRCYGSSRNLIRPEPDVAILDSDNWSDKPKENEIGGYELDTSVPVDNGEIVVFDIGAMWRYQAYRLLRKRE